MRKTFIKTVLLALGAVALFASCEPKEPVKKDVLVSISASSDKFTDGKVTLNLALSDKSSSDVTATIDASGSIPAAALSFEKSVSIAAGSTSASVPVTVDASALKAGSYETTFTLVSADGAKVDDTKKDCKVSITVEEEPAPVIVEVSIADYNDAFENGAAKLTLGLDAAPAKDVVVNLTLVAQMEDYNMVPAAAVSFENPVTIPAGSTSKEVSVTLDESALEIGLSYFAVIEIESVSDNAKKASRGLQAYIEAKRVMATKLMNDWVASYAGEQEIDGVVNSMISVSGVQGNYYLFVYTKGVVNNEFESIDEYLQYMEEKAIGPVLGTEDAYPIKSGDKQWAYNRFDVGEREIWVLGATPSGHLTGEYVNAEFTVTPTADMLAAYDNWLGEWNLNRTPITISENDRNEVSYVIKAGNYLIDANVGWNGELQFFVTDPCTEAGGEGFFAYYPSEQAGYINIYSGSSAIGRAILDETLKQANVESTRDGYYTGMAVFKYNDESFTGWGDLDIEFPATMKRPAENIDPNYEKWLGTWNVEGFTAPLTIGIDSANETYTMGLFYPGVSTTFAIVDFNAETGNLEFNFSPAGGTVSAGGTSYTLYLCGITNTNFVAMGNTDIDLLATAKLSEDGKTAAIEPNHYMDEGEETYAVQLGLLGYNKDSGWSNFGMLFPVPTTMTKQEAASAPAPKSVGTTAVASGERVAGKALKVRRIANARR